MDFIKQLASFHLGVKEKNMNLKNNVTYLGNVVLILRMFVASASNLYADSQLNFSNFTT